MLMLVPGLKVDSEAKQQQRGLSESHMMHRQIGWDRVAISLLLYLIFYTVPCQ